MNLHGLRIFHTIAVMGGVSRASEQLNISQPAVTMQLRKFEKELGLPLTRTNGRGIALTEFGLWLATQADRLFALEADIDKQCIAYQSGSIGNLTLAATYLPANYLLPSWLVEYRLTYPDVYVSMSSSNKQTALDKLLRYEADITFIGGHHDTFPDGLISTIVQEDELWFVARPDHPYASRTISYDELVQCPFIFREPGSYTRDALLTLCRTAGVLPPPPALLVNGPQEALRAVLAGLGITLASSIEVREYIYNRTLVQLQVEGPQATNVISCCIRSGDPLPPQAKAFLSLLELDL